MTLNCARCWRSGMCGVLLCHYSQVHSDQEWLYLLENHQWAKLILLALDRNTWNCITLDKLFILIVVCWMYNYLRRLSLLLLLFDSFESFSYQHQPIVFHGSLNDKSSQAFSTLLSILTDLNSAVTCIISNRVSNSSSPFTNPLVSAPSALITIGITVTFMFHSFFSSLVKSRVLVTWNYIIARNTWNQIIMPKRKCKCKKKGHETKEILRLRSKTYKWMKFRH